MSNVIVIGAQWGDEGKAKITDLLTDEASLVIRYQGGCNAGHTVVVGDETFKFHLIPSGILYGDKICMIGNGVVIHPEALRKELDGLISRNIDTSKLKISPLAHITMPYHIDIDSSSEKNLGKNKIGTTNKGIGPTYVDKFDRIGIRVEDLFDEEQLSAKLDRAIALKNKQLEGVYGLKHYTKQQLLDYCAKAAEIIKPYLCEDAVYMVSDYLKEGKNILLEGAQGTMLDIDYGTYPYVTSSNPIAGGACTGSGVGPAFVDEAVGISKAYLTRVGEGPFITELNDEYGKKLLEIGHEYGVTTGRPRRCGWFDALVSKYAVMVNGLTSMAITKLDVFDTFDEIKVCVAYKDKRNGKVYDKYVSNINVHKYLEPVYETYPGWKTSTSDVKSFDKLPENARNYIKALEKLIGCKISIVSVGPDRAQTIVLSNPFEKK